jgi:ubiquitin C-terminal hydrolase
MADDNLNYQLEQKLSEWGIIHPGFLNQIRYFCLYKYKCVKNVEVECIPKLLILRAFVSFKWYKIFGRDKILQSIKREFDAAMPEVIEFDNKVGGYVPARYKIEVEKCQKTTKKT